MNDHFHMSKERITNYTRTFLLYRSGKAFEHGECSLPPLEYSTRAFWIDISPTVRQAVEIAEGSILGGVHAAAHAILTVMTMILTVDPSDMECEHVRRH